MAGLAERHTTPALKFPFSRCRVTALIPTTICEHFPASKGCSSIETDSARQDVITGLLSSREATPTALSSSRCFLKGRSSEVRPLLTRFTAVKELGTYEVVAYLYLLVNTTNRFNSPRISAALSTATSGLSNVTQLCRMHEFL